MKEFSSSVNKVNTLLSRVGYFDSPKQKKKKSAREKALDFANHIQKPKL